MAQRTKTDFREQTQSDHHQGLFRRILLTIRSPWPNRLLQAAFALVIWLLYASLGPGADYFVTFTYLVQSPEKLQPIVGAPWTAHPGWFAGLMAPFVALPGRLGYILFLAATIAMLLIASRIFKGNWFLLLFSAQASWVFWWGQVEGWVALGLALGWIAHQKKNWPLLAIGIALASVKPHLGAIPALALWWWSGEDRWKTALALLGLFAASLLIWGPWPMWMVQTIQQTFLSKSETFQPWNISLGWHAMPLLIPAILLPLPRQKRLLVLTATSMLIMPYMPYYSSLILLCMPLPSILYPLAFLGYFPTILGTQVAWKGLIALPLGILAWTYTALAIKKVSSMPKIQEMLSQVKLPMPLLTRRILQAFGIEDKGLEPGNDSR